MVARSQYTALAKSAAASEALLAQIYHPRPQDGVVMSLAAMTGSYVSTQGAYDPYTQGYRSDRRDGHIVQRSGSSLLCRRDSDRQASAAGAYDGDGCMCGEPTSAVPLVYERMQPYVSPKIELSDQRLEQVDVRVLPDHFPFQASARSDALSWATGRCVYWEQIDAVTSPRCLQ